MSRVPGISDTLASQAIAAYRSRWTKVRARGLRVFGFSVRWGVVVGLATYLYSIRPQIADIPLARLTLEELTRFVGWVFLVTILLKWALSSKEKLYTLWGYLGVAVLCCALAIAIIWPDALGPLGLAAALDFSRRNQMHAVGVHEQRDAVQKTNHGSLVPDPVRPDSLRTGYK